MSNSPDHATSAQFKRIFGARAANLSQQDADHSSLDNSAQLDADRQPPAPSRFAKKAYSEEEKFELMSAYLDDEVSAQERRLIESWLASDSQLQNSYQQQLKLREAVQKLGSDLFE